MKVKDLYQGFMEDCVRIGLRPSTIYGHGNQIARVIQPTIGNIEVKDLKPIHASLIIEYANTQGASIANHAIVTLRRLLMCAKKSGIKFSFDIEEIEVPTYKRLKTVESLSTSEIARIRQFLALGSLSENKHSSHKTIRSQADSRTRTLCLFELLLHTGLRLSETLAINIEDINFEESEIYIRNVKTDEYEKVYIYGTVDILRSYIGNRTGALFVSCSGTRMGYNTAQSFLKKIKKKIGLQKNLNHHIFRKTFVTELLRARTDPKETQLLARHKSLRTTLDYYYKVQYEQLKPIHKKVIGNI